MLLSSLVLKSVTRFALWNATSKVTNSTPKLEAEFVEIDIGIEAKQGFVSQERNQ